MLRDLILCLLTLCGIFTLTFYVSLMFYLLAYLSVFKVFSHDAMPGEMVAICAGKH